MFTTKYCVPKVPVPFPAKSCQVEGASSRSQRFVARVRKLVKHETQLEDRSESDADGSMGIEYSPIIN